MFFGCCSAAGLSKRIVLKGTGDGGDSPQGVLDKFGNQYLGNSISGKIKRSASSYSSSEIVKISLRKYVIG